MNIFDYFKKNDQTINYNQTLIRFVDDYLQTPTEKTASGFLKCLLLCDIYLSVLEDSLEKETPPYPLLEKNDQNQWILPIHSQDFQTQETGYITHQTTMKEVLQIFDYISKLQVNKIVLICEERRITINPSFIQYLKLRSKRRII